MKRLTLASVAIAAMSMSLMAPVAHAAQVDGPKGALCGYDANTDPAPDAGPDAMTGEMDGGPLVWDQQFTLICVLQVGSNIHNGPSNDGPRNTADAVGSGSNYVAILPPTPINYDSPEGVQNYMCTELSYSGGMLYYQPSNPGPDTLPHTLDDVPGYWTTDANAACSAATQISTKPINDLVFGTVDGIVCPVIAGLNPTLANGPVIFVDREGDVFINGQTEADLFYDCPVYVPADATNGIFD